MDLTSNFLDAGRTQLRQQQICRHLQFGGKLGYVVTRHSVLFSMCRGDDKDTQIKPLQIQSDSRPWLAGLGTVVVLRVNQLHLIVGHIFKFTRNQCACTVDDRARMAPNSS
jgi:hypothetical protein